MDVRTSRVRATRLLRREGDGDRGTTLSQQSVRIKPGRWRHKWSLIGEGKIVFTTFVRGTPHTLTLRIYPVSERTFLQTMFLAGKNGPFGARSDMVFSAIVEESDDKASFGIDV